MTRTIELKLNKFPQIPSALLDRVAGTHVTQLSVAVKTLLHHYFLAKYGEDAEDSGNYEYEGRLTTGSDWRFKGSGIGIDKESKRNASNELGKGFARWFLYEHLTFTYFTPLEDLLERVNSDGSRWTRTRSGDLPDYVCGRNEADLNILEAKGRYKSVTFGTKEFQSFRDQVQCVQLLDGTGAPVQVKGFISVARWATETTPGVRATLYVEDPTTQGRPPGRNGFPQPVGRRMISGHYGPIFEILQLPLHAAAMRSGTALPARATAARGIWECVSGSLQGRRFIGGILPDRAVRLVGDPWWTFFHYDGPRQYGRWLRRASPFVLARPLKFFGVEEHVFKSVLKAANGGANALRAIELASVPEQTGSLSLLRDGTVLGPADYFEPVAIHEF